MKLLYHHRIRSKDGQYVHLEEIVRALRNLGHEVIVIGPGAIKREEFGGDGAFVAALKKCLPKFTYEIMEFAYSFVGFLRLLQAVHRYKPDGIYERYNLFFPAGIWVRRITGVPLLLEVNAPLLEERSRYGGLSLTNLAKWSEEYTWRGADYVLPVTRVLAQYVQRTGVPGNRIVVIPNGVDLAKLSENRNRDEDKQRLGLKGKLVLGFTGFVRDWHGLDRVLEFMARTRSNQPRHLLVTGDGPARQHLETRAKELGITQDMTITGIIGRDRVFQFVSAYDVALQPAVVSYASPLKLFEYLALGCAIVAPASANIKEILTDHENAILFDPVEENAFGLAVEKICADKELRNRLGAKARRTIVDLQLTWNDNGKRIVTLFELLGSQLRNPNGT